MSELLEWLRDSPFPLDQRAADEIERLRSALSEIREVWAGSEVGEPVYAQEAYVIRLCKQQYQIACDALREQK